MHHNTGINISVDNTVVTGMASCMHVNILEYYT
jgi:hypothetical protein